MSEIRFRLLSPHKSIVGYEKWYEGAFNKETGIPTAQPCWRYSKDGRVWTTHEIKHRYKDIFTGLFDKSGKEIYEGDLLRSIDHDELYRVDDMLPAHQHSHVTNIGYFMDGKYNPRSVGSQDDNHDDWMSWPEMYEIIGNVYENPDLTAR